MKKTFLMLFLACGVTFNTYAQQDNNTPFEGDLFYSSMENVNEYTQKISRGTVFNGKRNTVYTVRGKKVLFKDNSYHFTVLVDSEANTVVYYFNLLQKGVQFPYDQYRNISGGFTKEGPNVQGVSLAPMVYKFDSTGESINFKGQTAIKTKGHIETPTSVTDFDIYTIPMNVSKNIYLIQLGGLEVDGLVTKLSYVQENKMSQLDESAESKEAMDKQVKAITSNIMSDLSKMSRQEMMEYAEKIKKEQKEAYGVSSTELVSSKGRDKMVQGMGYDMSFEELTNTDMKSYMGLELKDIVYRTVDDTEFNLSGDIQIVTDMLSITGSAILPKLQSENTAYLKANNMYPDQITEDVVYDINEEWEY